MAKKCNPTCACGDPAVGSTVITTSTEASKNGASIIGNLTGNTSNPKAVTGVLATNDENIISEDDKKSASAWSKYWSSFGSNLNKSITSFMSEDWTKFSTLLSNLKDFNFNFDDVGNWFNGLIGSLGSSFSGILGDTLTNLKNSGVNFVSNIAENLYNDIKSSIYIPDEIFCATLQGLYYSSGADLSAGNNYIRDNALRRDWNKTLEFVNKCSNIKYSTLYSNMENELRIAATNSCVNNLKLMFTALYEEYESIEKELEHLYFVESNNDTLTNALRDNKALIEDWFMTYFKLLLINSKDNVLANDLFTFFKDFSKILRPKYFGETDDRYNFRYGITVLDINKFIPFFDPDSKYTYSDSDSSLSEFVYNNDENMKITANTIRSNQQIAKNNPDANKPNIIDDYRATAIENYTTKHKTYVKEAIERGSRSISDNARDNYENALQDYDDPSKVKYNNYDPAKGLTKTLDKFVRGMSFTDDPERFIDPNNKNIKKIYAMLASDVIFGENKLVNPIFHDRCKYPTMTKLIETADKAVGLLGSSMLVKGLTSLYDLASAMENSAYNYAVKVDQYLFTPGVSKTAQNVIDSYVGTYQIDPDSKAAVFVPVDELSDVELLELKRDTSADVRINGNDLNSMITTKNISTFNSISKFIDSNNSVNKELTNIMRFVSGLSMVTKRDIIVKYLEYFYNIMESRELDISVIKLTFATLIYSIFGLTGYSDTNNLMSLFDGSTGSSLNDNIKFMIAISLLNKENTYLRLKESYASDVTNLYKITIELMSREVESLAFVKAIYNYDHDYMKSYVKQVYESELDFLKVINSKDNPDYKLFYGSKDAITRSYSGYDKGGILGFNATKGLTQFTDVDYGDFSSIANTSKGIFFGGNENTSNNGIYLLDPTSGTLKQTNIDYGTWIKIVEINSNIFFINDVNELYIYTSNGVRKTNISDMDNWELRGVNGCTLLLSKNNGGIKQWNSTLNDFSIITNTGDNYKTYDTPYGNTVIYATGNKSNVYLASSGSIVNISDTTKLIVNNVITQTRTVITTSESSSGSDSQPSVVKTDHHHYLIGAKDGLYDCVYTNVVSPDGISVNSVTPIQQFNSKNTSIIKVDSNTGRIYSDGNVYTITFNTVENESTTLYTSIHEDESSYTNFILLNDYLLVYNNSLVKEIKTSKTITIDDTLQLNNAIPVIFNNKFYLKTTNDILYFNLSENRIYSIFDNDSDKVSGWEIYDSGNLTYINNKDKKLGIRVIHNGKSVDTNITDGSWSLCEGKTVVLALSKDGTNKGIRFTKLSLTPKFTEAINGYSMTIHDFTEAVYYSSTDKFYFGMNRSDTIFDVDNYNYDIDEFLYPLTLITLNRISNSFTTNKLNSMLAAYLIDIKSESESNFTYDLSVLLSNLRTITSVMISRLRASISKSSIYFDLLTYAEMNDDIDFDIDNDDILSKFECAFLYDMSSYDSMLAMLRIKSNNRKFIISNETSLIKKIEYTHSSNNNKSPINLSEFDDIPINSDNEKLYNVLSDDFLNSDINGDVYK